MSTCEHELKSGARKGDSCGRQCIKSGEYVDKYCSAHASQRQNKELREKAREDHPAKFANPSSSRKGVKTGSTGYTMWQKEKQAEWKKAQAKKTKKKVTEIKLDLDAFWEIYKGQYGDLSEDKKTGYEQKAKIENESRREEMETERSQCQAQSSKKKQCKNNAKVGGDLCSAHLTQEEKGKTVTLVSVSA